MSTGIVSMDEPGRRRACGGPSGFGSGKALGLEPRQEFPARKNPLVDPAIPETPRQQQNLPLPSPHREPGIDVKHTHGRVFATGVPAA